MLTVPRRSRPLLQHPGRVREQRAEHVVILSGDLTEFVVREVARTGWAVHARIRVDAPVAEVLARINPAVGTVEAHPDGAAYEKIKACPPLFYMVRLTSPRLSSDPSGRAIFLD